MKVTVTHLMGTNREIADYARTTIGLNGGDKKVSDDGYMMKLKNIAEKNNCKNILIV